MKIGKIGAVGLSMTNSNNNINLLTKDLEDGWKRLNREFPFEGYIRPARKSGYFEMVRRVAKWGGRNASVLDFGAGPCDKTALFAYVGMKITAFDDLQDAWHKLDGNKEKILDFAKSAGIEYCVPGTEGLLSIPDRQYDVLMSHDVLEHLHMSPRVLLNQLLQYVKPGGIMAITVPNAANLRKRIHLMMGKTNYNRFQYFYWYPELWRGHIREYVKKDLQLMTEFLQLELLDLSTYHLQLDVLPGYARQPFVAFSSLLPSVRDSWMLIARKPEDWQPAFKPDATQFKDAFGTQYYNYSDADFDWKA